MEIKILNESKEEIEFEMDNLTLAEILRVYLNKDQAVTMAAWKREHPTKSPVMILKTKGKAVKKALNDAVDTITKDLDKIDDEFKKMK